MTIEQKPELLIVNLQERHVGLSPSLAAAFTEAAFVCLNRHHSSPVDFGVANPKSVEHTIIFAKPNAVALNSWANETDTTEFGAYCLSLAAVEKVEQLVAVKRAETKSGADWYVAPVGSNLEDLESAFRLEISGIDAADESKFNARVKQKIEQTKKGKSNLPAIAAVVGFEACKIIIQRVEAPNELG